MPLIPLFNIHLGPTFTNNATPVKGTLWYDSGTNTLKIFNGSSWLSAGFYNALPSSAITMVTSQSYTVNLNTDFLVLINASNNNITVNIPAGTDGRMLILKRVDDNLSRVVTVSGRIDTVNSITLDPQEYKHLVFYAGSWRVIGS